MIHLSPWRFTLEDARQTIAALDAVVDHAAWQRPPGTFDAAHARALAVQQDEGDLEQRLRSAWSVLTSLRVMLADHSLLPQRTKGSVAGIFRSNGGVPKLPLETAAVRHDGVAGDRQATRRHHGRPWQALCLWSREVVDDLAAQGEPIAPGSAGENVSLTGIDWALVRPGVRLKIGDVLCEVTAYAIPCRQNAQWFRDGDFNTIHFSRGDVSRVYATVLEPGSITVGDTATLEP